MRGLLAVGAIFVALLTGILWIEASPVAGEPVAVISNPWGAPSAIDVVAAAGGMLLRSGRWRWIAVAANEDDPEFQRRLHQAGAWLLVSPVRLGACLDETRIEPGQANRS